MMQGAFVLTLASFIAKVLSAVYRVPYQNLVGDEGFYVYQQIYPIYGIAMTLALSGLPQFISKYVAEQRELRDRDDALFRLVPLITALSLALFAITFLGSGVIAALMTDSSLAPLIRVVSFTFLLTPFLSVYRGNFQGQLLMVPTAVSQVAEQLLRVGVILIAAVCFRFFGWDVYHTGTIAMSGAVIGGFFAVLILVGYEQKITGRRLFRKDKLVWRLPERALLRRFLIEGGLLTIFSGLLILFQLADSFIIKDALESYGLAEPLAKAAKGIYDRGQPLVQLGLVVASALSASFLPLLTKNFSRQEAGQFIRSGKIYLRITLALSLAASLGLALLLPYVNYALFKDYAGNSTLILFVFAIALMAQIQAYQSIAQSQNHFRASLKGAGWGFLVKLVLTRWLTTLMGTVGASLATLAGLSVVLFYLQAHADSRLKGFSKERHFGRRLFISLAVMFLVVITYYGVLQIVFGTIEHRSQALLASLAGVLFGGTSFIYCAIQTRLFTIREWLLLPFGKKILNFRKQGH